MGSLALCLALSVTGTGAARASDQIFLRLDGLAGEVMYTGYAGWSEAIGFNVGHGLASSAGPVRPRHLSVTKLVDRSSTGLAVGSCGSGLAVDAGARGHAGTGARHRQLGCRIAGDVLRPRAGGWARKRGWQAMAGTVARRNGGWNVRATVTGIVRPAPVVTSAADGTTFCFRIGTYSMRRAGARHCTEAAAAARTCTSGRAADPVGALPGCAIAASSARRGKHSLRRRLHGERRAHGVRGGHGRGDLSQDRRHDRSSSDRRRSVRLARRNREMRHVGDIGGSRIAQVHSHARMDRSA